jgi:ketosteroid isomerase-like protein
METKEAQETVLAFVKALNNEDFKTARPYLNDDFTFDGVMGTRNGADNYFKDMEQMKLKYEAKKAFADGNDVCLLCDLTMSGKTIFCCSWYHLKYGKISSLKAVFDPRPLFEKSEKK